MSYLEKRNTLPSNIQEFLSSDIPRQEAERICFLYTLKETDISALTYPIGLIFIKEIKLEDLPKIISEKILLSQQVIYGLSFELNKRIFARFPEYFTDALELLEQWQRLKASPIISEDEAWKKVLELEPWILENEKEEREAKKEARDEQMKAQSAIEKIAIRSALEKFPKLGEQLITSNHIKLKSFPEPVRPSINNWLSDYTFSLGFESHSAMDRGTYLFRNENAKVLNSTDREKISHILKAYDENSLVDVNVNTKQIIFSRHETRISEQGSVNNEQRTIINDQQARVNTPQFQAPRGNISEVYNAIKQSNQPKDIFKEERMATENRNAGNINFSSPQKLPYEKQTIRPIQQPLPNPSPQPMRISSQNMRKTDVPPGNIVNLKQ